MIRHASRSSQVATPAPPPSSAHPSSSSLTAPQELPSGPAQERAVLCVVDMDIHVQGMPLYTVPKSVSGERDRPGRWGWRPRQPLPPPIIQATPRCFHPHPGQPRRVPDTGAMADVLPVSSEQTVRICTTLHHFAPLCSDFAARSQIQPSENQSMLLPTTWTHSRSQTVPIRFPISVQFWSGLGLVSSARPVRLRRRLKPQISVKKPPLTAWRLPLCACRSRLPWQISKEFKVIQRNSNQNMCPSHPPIGPAAACRLALSFLGHRK